MKGKSKSGKKAQVGKKASTAAMENMRQAMMSRKSGKRGG
jgi:hypothetical protein